MKVSHARFGDLQLCDGQKRLHVQARVDGRDYLALLCWKEEPSQWSWHFYNRKADTAFWNLPEAERLGTLKKILRGGPQALRSLLSCFQVPEESAEVESVEMETVEEVSENTVFQHDLLGYMEELNATYFNPPVNVPVSWTRKSHKNYHYGMTFGTFCLEKIEIKISSRLNQTWIPDFFVKHVLYHEMLHAVISPVRINGKTWVHHKEFRVRERLFEQHREAVLWQRQNLRRLMKSPHKKSREIPRIILK